MEQEGGGDEGKDDRNNFFLTNMKHVNSLPVANHSRKETDPWVDPRHGCAMWATSLLRELSDNWLPHCIIFSKCHERDCLLCMQKNCSEYSYPVLNS